MRFRITNANSFFHDLFITPLQLMASLKCFTVQISEIFAAYGFWIIGMSKICDGKIRQCFNMFLLHTNITQLVRYIYF